MSFPRVPLGEIFDIARGGSPRPIDAYITDASDGVNWISIKDASNSSKYIKKTKKKILQSGALKSRRVKPGDFLLTNSMSFGRPYILQTDGCIHDGWLVLSGDERIVDQDFFYHVLGSDHTYRQFSSIAAGAVVKNLNTTLVKTVLVPLPPLSEQRRIAAILDKADALRAQRRTAIAKLDELLQSVFVEMFGDPVTNPKGWPIRKIADLLDSVKYGSSDKATQEGEIPILRMNNLTYSGQIELSELKYITAKQADEKYLVEPGDILFNRTNSKELVGKTAVYEGPIPMAYAGYLVRGRVNQSNAPEYISAFLNSVWGKAILRNMCKNIVGMANINAREFGTIELPVPPSELQRKFQHYVRAVRAQKQRMQEGAKKLDELFASLQQRAFSGKL
ncbi:restriction endonuclease subunit S [Achromobacter kerstersii]|uniref:Type-1 restriction enzyme EcoKI specificity protein n=1 Tax=Achromobacter kerstersii TaxID=1353890 RepID=A0A6S7B2T1_9BURK|nr:restriction endonuclease subunit S [Achromobacter kerstersii]CAB3714245.1 Type-1 restriction enzyme EcoKI specificity protein [Achromobacter kerstersii]